MITQFEKYLSKHPHYPNLISLSPHKLLNKIVTIPAFNEPNIISTLTSLKACENPKYATEVIILVNHSKSTPTAIVEQNKSTYQEITHWIKNNSTKQLCFHVLLIENFIEKYAGVGLARKILMDEAIKRFSQIEQENGIIISLDADTTVSQNYLYEIERSFLENSKQNVALPSFEHTIENKDFDNASAIQQYELHLRYFKLALKTTGFPYAYHTIGSAFAVSAMTYVKQGGMNKKQGGEDFYFLQKVFQLGNTKELNDVTVFPSSRPSDRVPFGTGPAVIKIIEEGVFYTYNPIYFNFLKVLFDKVLSLFNSNENSIINTYSQLHPSIKEFIPFKEFLSRINEINNNSASEKTFTQRFYHWFDAFKIIKYLNEVHLTNKRIPIIEAAKQFLNILNLQSNSNESLANLLGEFKKLEMDNSVSYPN